MNALVSPANIPSVPYVAKGKIVFKPDLANIAKNKILSSINAVNLIALFFDKNLKIILIVCG
jgi:hypothetical protein